MHATTGAASIALLAMAGSSVVQAEGMRKHMQWHQQRASMIPDTSEPKLAVRGNYEKPHLNSKTKQFEVDGAGLPQVDFDIGESYAGSLPIDSANNGSTLWFWYVPSTNPDAGNEITIWLNGGPGCSSLDGFFHENGPVVWPAGTYRPVKNDWAYSNLTNTVWIDQPVGTGFSTGTVTAKDEIDVATQFRGFWKNFVDTFDLHGRDVYITGESYAGMYVPYIADGMLNQTDTEYFNVQGIQIYDPSIGEDILAEGAATKAFVDVNKVVMPLDDTTYAELANKSEACGFDKVMHDGLQFPPDKDSVVPLPPASSSSSSGDCDVFNSVINYMSTINPCFNIYYVSQTCPVLWDVLGFPYSSFYLPPGYDTPYFNHPDVKKAINAPANHDWAICSSGNVFAGPGGQDQSPPSALNGGPLARVAEKTNNVIVGHAMLDMVLFSNGSLITLNNLTWNGDQGFSEPPEKPFYVPYHADDDFPVSEYTGGGVLGGWVEERGLTFVTIELSGHTVPSYEAGAAYRILEKLLGRVEKLDEISPFSTRPWEKGLNPKKELGKGRW